MNDTEFTGFIPSDFDGTEFKFEADTGFKLPTRYSYQDVLPPVMSQGSLPICVPCSITAHLNWNANMDREDGLVVDNNVRYMDIYEQGKVANGEGMTFKSALKFLRHNGVMSDRGLLKIDRYAMITTVDELRQALVLNGPCIAGLPFYGNTREFWKGTNFNGGHAISIVGYDEQGFIIRNSWGPTYADNGHTKLRYQEFPIIMEAWCIID